MLKPLESWDSNATRATFHTGMYHGTFQGRDMQKLADDLDRYKEVIDDTVPDLVVEVGTRYGGSALWFNQVCGVQVISIDVAPQLGTRSSYTAHPGIEYIVGNSIEPTLIESVKQKIVGKRVMVSLDGDHHATHVWQEITLYSQMVTRGCFMVVEDACFDMWEGEDARRGGRRIPEEGGPLKAMQLAGLDHNPLWKRDEVVEGITPISHSPAGWWERR